jgi:hypothetical protein
MLIFFPGEQTLSRYAEGAITLTTHRVMYDYKIKGFNSHQSVMLEHITSCKNYPYGQITYLVLSAALLSLGAIAAYLGEPDILAPAGFIAILFAVLYWMTHRKHVVIGSLTTKMPIQMEGLDRKQVLDFISDVNQAKEQRVLSLQTKTNVVHLTAGHLQVTGGVK